MTLALDNATERRRGIGLGEDLRFDGNGSEGAGLVLERELIQLTAFPSDDAGDASAMALRRSRVRRPSSRRSGGGR